MNNEKFCQSNAYSTENQETSQNPLEDQRASEPNTEHILVRPEVKERLEALKYNQKEPLGDVVLRLTGPYFTEI